MSTIPTKDETQLFDKEKDTPKPAFVDVVEGAYELGIDDQPTKTYKAGETFQGPSGCLHRVSSNPASSGNARLIAAVLHPRDVKEILIPAEH